MFVEKAANWQLALPATLTIVLAFLAGGFFPGSIGLTAGLLCLLLVARVTLAERPFAGWSAPLAVTAGVLALFSAWTLASSSWSDAPARALTEFDRAFLYLLVLALLGLSARGPRHLSVLLRWVGLAMAVTCGIALATKLLPEEFPTSAFATGFARLAFPLTYWNATGMLCGLAAIVLTHLTASEREPAAVRVAAAAALPVVAVTLYLTFSRGAIAATIGGLVLYLVLAHPRGLIAALPTVGLPVAFALERAYGSELLARDSYEGPGVPEEGRALLGVVVGCVVAAAAMRALGLLIDRQVLRVRIGTRTRRGVYGAAAVGALLALGAATIAFDLPDRVKEQHDAFVAGNNLRGGADVRTRLTQIGNNGRVDHWRVALAEARRHPWRGSGAGTYRLLWERGRASNFKVTEAHSLYYEVRSELGWIGVVLLAIALAVPLGVAASRLRGPGRHAYALFIAGGMALLLHAGVDWDWEMPALFIWFFGAAGVILAAPADAAVRLPEPRRLTRLLAGLACLLAALTPVTVGVSQLRLNRSVDAFDRGDCVTATDAALDSLDALSVQAEAFEVLGWCNARAGQQRLASDAMRAARIRDPDNWQYAYGMAVVLANGGEDGRPEAELAVRLNPREPLTRRLARDLRAAGQTPKRRRAVAAKATIPLE